MFTCDLKKIKAAANAAAGKDDPRFALTNIYISGNKVAATDSYILLETDSGCDNMGELGKNGYMFPAYIFAKAKVYANKPNQVTFELMQECKNGEIIFKVLFNGIEQIVTAYDGDAFPKYQRLFDDFNKNFEAILQQNYTLETIEKAIKCLSIIAGNKKEKIEVKYNGEDRPCVFALRNQDRDTRCLVMPATTK